MKFETLIVISKYNENIEWVTKLQYPFIIYDKSDNPIENSIKRPNVGRECETLLYYIITNYENLPNITIFLQGDPRSNPIKYTYGEVVEELNKKHISQLNTILTWEGTVDLEKHHWIKSSSILHQLLFEGNTITTYSSGVQYVIPKDCILNRPIELYKILHKLVIKYGNKHLDINKKNLNDGIDAWTMESVWGSIFNKNKVLKRDYYEKLNNIKCI